MSKKNRKSKVSSSKSEKETTSSKEEVTSSTSEKETSSTSEKESPKVSANEVKVKAHKNGVRFTGPYRTELPGSLIQDLKTRDKEVIMDKKYLDFLVIDSYEIVE